MSKAKKIKSSPKTR